MSGLGRQKHLRKALEALEQDGMTVVEVRVNSSTHYTVTVAGEAGATVRISIAGSPRDPDNAITTARQCARRALRCRS